ncbi:MAG: class I SAM-dependent methyltransferase, partial [Anaerolineales bacterium]|nr:class I SAM-dependent methyltransferase [Anaerolineales bacterium]
IRYLAAKKTVDDRALNARVWQAMAAALPAAAHGRPPRVLELGAGIGTMAERLVAWGVLADGVYTAVDASPANIAAARQRLAQLPAGLRLELEAIDLYAFAAREAGRRTWDLLIANALLDLLDVPATLPRLWPLLPPGGLFYFTITFDGATILQPTIDAAFDARVEALYHETMDTRGSGGSQAGRRLFAQVRQAGGTVLAAGSSDWVVFAGPDGYPADEAAFLRAIVDMMHAALAGHPALDPARFAAWIAQRHAQIDAGELVYIAHQLDMLGRAPGRKP